MTGKLGKLMKKNKSHFEQFVNEWTLVYFVIFFESNKKINDSNTRLRLKLGVQYQKN